ncbi:MAG: HAD family hydrolase [Candidatus Omnitrophota bacterium]
MGKNQRMLAITFAIVCLSISVCLAAPLESWNETPNKERIINFVSSVSDPASPSYVPEKERIAAFDLDGTIFCEKPLYLQVLIAAERLHDLAEKNPLLQSVEPYASAWERDWDYISDPKNFLEMNLTAFEGATEEEYKKYVENFLNTKKNPDFKVPYIELFYIPMLELLEFLKANDFQVYIVSGSPQEFIRSFSEAKLDTPLEKVIGDTISVAFQVQDSRAVFVRKHAVVEPEVLREGKPENIRMRVGRVPILAFGNSNDDIAMLESAAAGGLPSLSLTLYHDDSKREYAYDKGADKVLKTAKERGWVIVSMKEDFKTIFKFKKSR